jgi:hypothetical protein
VAYRACWQELEELIERALLVEQVESVETVEASSSPVRPWWTSLPVEEHGTVSEGQEPVGQDDFPIDNTNDDDDDDDDDGSEEEEDSAIPSNRPSSPWDPFWRDMESICGRISHTGGRPYLFVKPGRNTRPGESRLGVDYLNNAVDLQGYASQHHG